MSNRSLTALTSKVMSKAVHFSDQCARQGLNVLIYCTYRSFEEQARLYRKGRSIGQIIRKKNQLVRIGRSDLGRILIDVGPQKGRKIRTYAGPGQSLHNYGLAFDGCPLQDGKPVWEIEDEEDLQMWEQYGRIAESVGLEWAGTWKKFREYPHCQEPGMNWRELIQNHE